MYFPKTAQQSCPATARNVILSLVIGAVYALYSHVGVAATDTEATKAASAQTLNVELKPLPAIFTLVPGSVGAGAEVEYALNDHLGVHVEAQHVELNLSNKFIDDYQEDHEDDAIVQRGRTTTIGTGLRYYGSTQESSWYAGGKVMATKSSARWRYQDQRFRDESTSASIGGEGGYRWLFASGFNIRLGGGVALTSMPNRELEPVSGEDNEKTREAKDDIEDKASGRKTQVTPLLDFGLGWAF
jgi:hypothetical protein